MLSEFLRGEIVSVCVLHVLTRDSYWQSRDKRTLAHVKEIPDNLDS